MKEDNISQLGDYDAPFCEQQYTHGSCYISLFKFKSFDQLIPPPNCLKFETFTQLWHYSTPISLKFYMRNAFMDIMTHAKFHFNRLMLTLIFGIRASEPPPPRAWQTTEKAGPDRVKILF